MLIKQQTVENIDYLEAELSLRIAVSRIKIRGPNPWYRWIGND